MEWETVKKAGELVRRKNECEGNMARIDDFKERFIQLFHGAKTSIDHIDHIDIKVTLNYSSCPQGERTFDLDEAQMLEVINLIESQFVNRANDINCELRNL